MGFYFYKKHIGEELYQKIYEEIVLHFPIHSVKLYTAFKACIDMDYIYLL